MSASLFPFTRRCRWRHRYERIWWANIAPISGGGPRFVEQICKRCGNVKRVRNFYD